MAREIIRPLLFFHLFAGLACLAAALRGGSVDPDKAPSLFQNTEYDDAMSKLLLAAFVVFALGALVSLVALFAGLFINQAAPPAAQMMTMGGMPMAPPPMPAYY